MNAARLEFLPFERLPVLFEGCVYLPGRHMVRIPGGLDLTPTSFRRLYGRFVFGITADNARTSCDAWVAFSVSMCPAVP